MCGKVLPPRRRQYCSDKCANRKRQVSLYGLSAEDQRILRGDGTCPICARRVRKWNVDHDHKTNLVRGLVCGACNQRVLTVIATLDKAERLWQYMKAPPAERLPGTPRIVGEKIRNKKGRYV